MSVDHRHRVTRLALRHRTVKAKTDALWDQLGDACAAAALEGIRAPELSGLTGLHPEVVRRMLVRRGVRGRR